jgi:O-antigen ligase
VISNLESKFISTVVLLVGCGAGLFILPGIAQDPINLPKLFLIVLAASTLLGMLATKLPHVFVISNKAYLAILALFSTHITLVLLFSGAPFTQQFYGTNGRNTGYLAYISLIIIALASSLFSNLSMLQKSSYALILMGIVSGFYGILQTLGADPIKWNNPYNSVITFLGNPNFASSFLGICAVVIFAYLLADKISWTMKFVLAITCLTLIALTLRSNSQQGTLVFLVGAAFVFLVFLKSHSRYSRKPFFLGYISIVTISGILVLLGTLKLGPFADLLYKLSVRQRGYYWHAAREMMFSHPFFGIGLDSYGDWYFSTRSSDAAINTPQTQSNSAHSIFLDLGASGGIPLFILNISLSALTFFAIFRILRRQESFNWAFAAIAGAWIAYEAQAVISINQLGLGIWGWILMGLLIGYEFRTRPGTPQVKTNLSSTVKRKIGNQGKIISIKLSAGLLVGMLIGLPMLLADIKFRTATTKPDAQNLINASLAKPIDLDRTLLAAELLAKSNLNSAALALIDRVIEGNPRDINAWDIKFKLSAPGTADYLEAKLKLNSLNPRIPIK